MKKLFFMTMNMVFALTLGLAYAGNSVTDFTGRSYDTLELAQIREIAHVEGSGAGGLRAGEAMKELSNGVSDFSGKLYDSL
jgi:hypothetical protein